jgi:hypothetical protein
MGFLRHGWESLDKCVEWEDAGRSHILPGRIFYPMLPTSGYSLVGCSPAEPTSALPDTFCSSLNAAGPALVPPEIIASTLLTRLCRKPLNAKWFIVFHHCPGNDQHFSGHFHTCFGFDTAFARSVFLYAMIQVAKLRVVI